MDQKAGWKTMHVLHIPSWYVRQDDPAKGSFFREQAIALNESGMCVGVIAPDETPERKYDRFSIDTFDDNGVLTLRSRRKNWLPWNISPLDTVPWLAGGMALYRAYEKQHGRPQILHAQGLQKAGFLAAWINAQHGIPYVVTEHSSVYFRKKLPYWQKLAAGLPVKNAARRFAVSRALCDAMEQNWPSTAGSWDVLPNMVQVAAERTPLRSTDSFNILHISLLDENKDVGMLVRAFANAFGADMRAQLTIGGDGQERQRLQTLSKELGISDRVRFPGYLDRAQVAREMANADLFVLSSRHETFGVVLIEALAAGTPIVATACGGPQDIVTPDDGLLVPVGDVSAMSAALATMRQNIASYDAEDIRVRCNARFGKRAFVQRLTGVYESVIAENRPAD